MRSIQPFIHHKIIVLHQDATASEAARAMRDRQIGCVVVSDRKGGIVGIVTDRDIVNRMVGERRSADTPLSQIMTPNPVVIREAAGLKVAIAQMELHGIRRIPVIEKQRGIAVRCVGIVSLDDLMASGAIDHPHLMRIVRSQILRRFGRKTEAQSRIDRERSRKETEDLYAVIAGKMGPKLELSRRELEDLSMLVFRSIVRRLHHTGAMHLIMELPKPVQDELLEVPSGPDPTVRASWVLREIERLFDVDDATAYTVLTRFCSALEAWCESEQLDQVKAQLPKEFQNFFTLREAEKEKRAKAA